ncbi:TMEM175 family protein [Frankia sp. R82]|uniref:TMEM175 family protein n=1 Tax=Frankia sp. R82 TaxID=2950553 RepID=UPI0020444CB9|nr:TMEM175 family protein [Frankia sp. R82]MCM3887094.1 TMEM175 family protein [Frankia sp. R82]
MRTSRLEAFSDGVLAIIITIMVLELKVPEGNTFADLRHATGKGLLSYVLSFVYVGIYWNNHHHMFQLARRVTGGVLWANLGLLFCLSLFPFTTAWMDESDYARFPVLLFGVNLLAAACVYNVLQWVVIGAHGPESPLRQAIGADLKGRVSPLLYLVGILCAQFVDPHGRLGVVIASGCYILVALIWIVPDRRIGRVAREVDSPD